MTNTWYASDWDQAYRPSYAKIRRTVVRHIQVHLYLQVNLRVYRANSFDVWGQYVSGLGRHGVNISHCHHSSPNPEASLSCSTVAADRLCYQRTTDRDSLGAERGVASVHKSLLAILCARNWMGGLVSWNDPWVWRDGRGGAGGQEINPQKSIKRMNMIKHFITIEIFTHNIMPISLIVYPLYYYFMHS